MQLSFMSASLVGLAGGFAARDWAGAEAATHAWMEPPETFSERFDDVLAVASEAGFARIDVWLGHLHPRWATAAHVAAARAALGRRGLAVTSLAGSFGASPGDVAAACLLGGELGTALLGGSCAALDAQRPGVLAVLREHGAVLAIENHPGMERPADVLRAIGDDRDVLGAAADTGWFATVGVEVADAVAALRGHIAHVHLKDVLAGPDHVNCPYGAGVVDLAGAVRSLAAGGYDGAISVEYHPLDAGPRPALSGLRAEAERLLAAA